MRTRVCVPWVVAVAMVALTQAPPSAQNRRSEAPDIPRLPFERYTLPISSPLEPFFAPCLFD